MISARIISSIMVVWLASTTFAVEVVIDRQAGPRVEYGANRLLGAIKSESIDASLSRDSSIASSKIILTKGGTCEPEGFSIDSQPDGSIIVNGRDDSGELYGALELARRIHESHALPPRIHFSDAPVFKLRGPCIGMQKTYILPGRHVYEYPYTPELFPFFYDKQFWTEYLDFLATNRMNTLYLWSGHPFASLVKLKDYPYALEVPQDVFQKNQEMFRWITTEADKRGIWVVQMFYNILISKPFAEHNNLPTQLAAPNDLAADYTRKSITEFVHQYPHVGLMLCLGEALKGEENQKYWLDQVVLPGVKDGMKLAGLTEEPPVIVRRHAAPLETIMPEAVMFYGNLYTETKYTGESLTTSEPRGKWQDIFHQMAKLGSTSIANIHILSNLEPFRYGDQRFIQQCVKAARDRLDCKGMHIYPLSYWNWPDAPDKTNPPLKQLDRDWIWFEAWARYSWNPDIDPQTDHAYWVDRIAEKYGNKEAAEKILEAYNDSGECAPRLIRRFGITEGNRQTLSLGMTLDQLAHPEKYGELPDLWESDAPPGERINVYVKREWNHEPHEGETPVSINKEVLRFSRQACDAIDAAEPLVTKNRDEYERLKNDVHCIDEMSRNYAAKVNAAMLILRYDLSHNPADMEQAATYLAESLEHYRNLVKLTDDTYNYANSMQTSQRKIPFVGGKDGKPANYLWSQCLPMYEKELADFQKQVKAFKEPPVPSTKESETKPLPKASFTVLTPGVQTYDVTVGAKPFSDRDDQITALAPELNGLTGIRISQSDTQKGNYTPIEFECNEPVQVLVGYMRDTDKKWLQVPRLETDAAADEHIDVQPAITNAATIQSAPPVDVHVFNYEKGRNKIDVRGSGSFVVLGIVPKSATIAHRDAHCDK